MNALHHARMKAMSTPVPGPVHEAAVALCILRGIEPNLVQLHAGMLNWQAIVAEQVLTEIIQTEVRR